jgi:hypothetical protein
VEGFDRFWKLWPKHERKTGKTKCKKLWEQNKLEPKTENVLAVLTAAITSDQWTRENSRYIPLPATWLNQGLWDADPSDLFAGGNVAANPASLDGLTEEQRKRFVTYPTAITLKRFLELEGKTP